MKIVDSIYARVCERRKNYETIVVSKFPDLFPILHPIVLGQYSITEQAGKRGERRRFITRRDSIKLGEHIETPTAIARDYLNVERLRAPRLRGNIDAIRQANARGAFAPNLALPQQFDDGFYVDIRACYYSLLRLVGWNVNYSPGQYLSAGDPMLFPFPDHRIARDSLVSMARPHQIVKVFPPGGSQNMKREYGHNHYLNLALSAFVSDVLHALAWLAYQAGAIYVNTDGYIAPNFSVRRSIEQVIADFGLTSRVKYRGAGQVLSSGAYDIGDHLTKHDHYRNNKPISNIDKIDHARWLQTNLEFWAMKRG